MPMPLTARLKRKKKTFFGSKKSAGSGGDDELVCPLNLGRHDDPSRRPSHGSKSQKMKNTTIFLNPQSINIVPP